MDSFPLNLLDTPLSYFIGKDSRLEYSLDAVSQTVSLHLIHPATFEETSFENWMDVYKDFIAWVQTNSPSPEVDSDYPVHLQIFKATNQIALRTRLGGGNAIVIPKIYEVEFAISCGQYFIPSTVRGG